MKQRHPRSPHRGFTLVELMVSMAIGLLLVLAMITLLINVNRNNSELSKTNRLIENGRFAMQLLQADIVHAGYWDGFIPGFDDMDATGVPADVPTAVPDPCLAYTVADWTAAYKTSLLGIAVQGYEIPATVPSPTLSVCADRVVNPKASTDVLFVRHAESCVPGVSNCAADTAGELYLQVQRCGTSVPTPPYVLDTTGFTLQKRNCAAAADKRKYVSSLYYIRSYATTVGDGVPTLMRSQFGLSGGVLGYKAADALIEGIEGFRVEYGVDNVSDSGEAVNFTQAVVWADPAKLVSPRNRGDGIPDANYIRCTTATPCTVAQLMNVTAVKLYVLVRSERATPGYQDTKTYEMGSTTLGPFNDAFKRHLFTQTMRLTNVAGRRETP